MTPLEGGPSTVVTKTTNEGNTESYDSTLDQNVPSKTPKTSHPNFGNTLSAIYTRQSSRFISWVLLAFLIVGTHQETHQVRVAAQNGQPAHYRNEVRTVTDFAFTLDMSCFVSPQWSQIGCTGPNATFKETIDAYSKSNSKFKR